MWWFKKRVSAFQLDPDEILLDSSNLPSFNTQQFEGRIERPINKNFFYGLGIFCTLIFIVLLGKVVQLEVINGAAFAERSASNTLRHIPIFAERGVITDRNGVELAWNTPERTYTTLPGFGHLLGYVSYPTEKELATNDYDPKQMVGRDGAEKSFNDLLQGERGIKIEEVDVAGKIQTDYILDPPKTGANLNLSIDSRLQTKLYEAIHGLIAEGRFVAGAGVIMNVKTGEILALTSAPEYDSNVLAKGDDSDTISSYLNDKRQLFLNRVIDGLYTPGSVVKPIMALAALQEGVVTPETKILSTGQISLPNPYNPKQPSIFKDWKAHGWVNLREAIQVSSDVYFYEVGGGYQNQKGIGIANIDKYAGMFGFGKPTGIKFLDEEQGVIPTPEWKAKIFDGEPWRIGDTYHTVIGQYGFQVTPIQITRAIAAVATSGKLVTPTVLKQTDPAAVVETQTITDIKQAYYQVVREGMRMSAQNGTAVALNVPGLAVGAKTGTAELGVSKDYVNSWVTGFFPYDNPRYSFAIVMERGKKTNLIGAPYAMRQVLDWMVANAPEYTK